MPERFEIYIVYKRCYINTLPFLFITNLAGLLDKCKAWIDEPFEYGEDDAGVFFGL